MAAATSTLAYNPSTALFAICVRIASSAIIFCETDLNPSASSAVWATKYPTVPMNASTIATTVRARAPI